MTSRSPCTFSRHRLWAPFVVLLSMFMGVGVAAEAGPGELREVDAEGSVSGAALDPIRNRLYVRVGSTVGAYDSQSDAFLGRLYFQDSGSIAVNPENGRLYVSYDVSGDDFLVVVDGPSLTIITTLPVESGRIAINPTTNRIYVTDFRGQAVTVVDGESNRIIDTFRPGPEGVRAFPVDVAVDSKTNRIYVAMQAYYHVAVIDGYTNEVIADIDTPGYLDGMLAVDDETQRLFVAFGADANFHVIDTSTNRVIKSIVMDTDTQGIAVSMATNRVYLSQWGGGEWYEPLYLRVYDQSLDRFVEAGRTVGFGKMAIHPTDFRIFMPNHFRGSYSVLTEDAVPPTSTMSVASGAVLAKGQVVSGTVSDDFTGVAKVSVTLGPTYPFLTTQLEVTLVCSGDGRSCTWTAKAPDNAGVYLIQVQGSDRAGSTEAAGPSPRRTCAGPLYPTTCVGEERTGPSALVTVV